MDHNFYTDEFERLIRQKADQYKMYPSDHVWKGVYKALHGRRRWYLTGLGVLLLGFGVFTADYFLINSTKKLTNNLQSNLDAVQQAGVISKPTADNTSDPASRTSSRGSTSSPNDVAITPPLPITYENQLYQISNMDDDRKLNSELIASLAPTSTVNNNIAKANDQSDLSLAITQVVADAASESANVKQDKQINWLQEYATYKLAPAKQKKMAWLLYFSPTVNYRRLTGNGSGYYPASEIQSVPIALSFNGEVDQYVNHKPAFGFELGSNLQFRTTRRLTLKAGVQFNYSQYNIEAYASHPEKATIALNSNYNADTIVSYTSVRNMSGYAQQELSNQYFQVSFPVGVELRVFGNEKLQLNVAGTIQPTYLLNRNSYMITTDYKNYTKEPSLVRRWNVNAGVETFVAYHTGTVRWQLGPQFRYQVLSSYIDRYPIKEYLMEYGFKIGVSKTLK
ncbi:MAG TPA: outer membrane beta-barrel protein [Chitinophagaceae bacterium]|nr:outer membrane beta-barrel protein [Chitinophagaceae bacterium]